MIISIKEENLTASVELGLNEEWDYEASWEEVLIAAFECPEEDILGTISDECLLPGKSWKFRTPG